MSFQERQSHRVFQASVALRRAGKELEKALEGGSPTADLQAAYAVCKGNYREAQISREAGCRFPPSGVA